MKKLATALAWFTSGSFVGTLTQIAKGKLGAIYLGPEGTGILNQLNNIWSLFNAISGLSFYNGVVRRIAEAKSDNDIEMLTRQLSTSLIFLTFFSCFIAASATAFSSWISDIIFGDSGSRSGLVAITLLSVPLAVTAQTYRGLLSGCRLVRPIVSAQVFSDICALVLFVFLVINYRLDGAVIAFSLLHLIKVFFQLWYVKKSLPDCSLWPRFQAFSWAEVGVNWSFGLNGLVMSGLSIGTILIVTRWIITDLGMAENGIFAVAWKVACLYLGAIYAAASGYYFSSLVACKNNDDLTTQINEAVSLYMFVLPPVIALLIASGDLLISALFSSEFAPAAWLLVFMLPGDLFRVTAETVGLSFLARRKIVLYTLVYFVWASMFLIFSLFSMPIFGLVGVALAYLSAHLIYSFVVFFHARRDFNFSFTLKTKRILLLAMGLVLASMLSAVLVSNLILRAFLIVLAVIFWMLLNFRDESFRSLLLSLSSRFR